jgi:hypothetical protein
MRKRAMVIGLLLVPLATGGAVLLAKSSHQSTPKTKATISLPNSENTTSEYSPGEGSGFVLAPSDANAEPRDLKQQQSEEQQKREEPKQPSSEDIDSDHAATEILFASESESAEILEGAPPAISSARDFFNSYAFANSRRSSGSTGAGAGAGAAGQSSGAAPSADSKSPQNNSNLEEEHAPIGEPQASHPLTPSEDQPAASDSAQDSSSSGETHGNTGTSHDEDEPVAEETPPQTIPVPYFPPQDERPHVTVPEPSTLMLLGLGLLACAAASRRRRMKLN